MLERRLVERERLERQRRELRAKGATTAELEARFLLKGSDFRFGLAQADAGDRELWVGLITIAGRPYRLEEVEGTLVLHGGPHHHITTVAELAAAMRSRDWTPAPKRWPTWEGPLSAEPAPSN
ncbi:hypothetical protein KSP35_05400 [Aquihabitans sp. G128]|uniref:hypothetical protein n=1 Tax=Aquihabitans sp. G128 TaxID=2849779 RepID=UPI001C22DD6E|nr:hypothetical protein [Aquihabitans sp. G128]QXC62244.1 hypothetical protein KSP35_05400 [Aquihabitans sp. G128]